MMIIIMKIENDNDNRHNDDKNDNNSVDDENNDNDNKIAVDSPPKGPIMLSVDVTCVESKNKSRVSGFLRRHVPHVTSL